jgi:hypothetical protein
MSVISFNKYFSTTLCSLVPRPEAFAEILLAVSSPTLFRHSKMAFLLYDDRTVVIEG